MLPLSSRPSRHFWGALGSPHRTPPRLRRRVGCFAEEGGLADPFEVGDGNTEWSYPDLATAVRDLNSAGSARLVADRTSEGAATHAHEAASGHK